jgi:hypothetical protein
VEFCRKKSFGGSDGVLQFDFLWSRFGEGYMHPQ